MDKKMICPVDKRRFSTKAALDQHRRDAHGASGARKVAQSSQLHGYPSRGGPHNVLAQPQRVLGRVPTDTASLSGVDRLLHIDDVSKLASGSVVFNFTVVPSGFKRLAKVAAAFQHIRYHRLVFRVEPQMSAVTGGGYVAGFVGDPDDVVSSLDQLTAVRGSVTTKWWQAATVNAAVSNKQFFTSHGIELRDYSPGVFTMIVDGAATQAGSMTIFAEWQVSLQGAILEAPASKTVMFTTDVFVRKDQKGLWVQKNNDWSSQATDVTGSDAVVGNSYRLPYPVSLPRPNDQVLSLHHYVYIQSKSQVVLCTSHPTDWYDSAYANDNLVITAGTAVDRVTAPAKLQGEELEPSSSDSEVMTASQMQLLGSLEKLLSNFALLGKSSSALDPKQPQ